MSGDKTGRGWWGPAEWAAPWLLGAMLRVYQLPTQVLVDDEWHMVHRLRDGGPFWDFSTNDHSIGLTALSWLLMRVVTADEMVLRLPSLAAGLTLLVVWPRWIGRRLGREVGIVSAWLLAVSPLLCFFSRLARPYAVTTLLATVAVLSFHRWFASGGRDLRAALAYVASAGLAPVFHLPALPAVLAPFALPVLARMGAVASSRVSLVRLAALAVATTGMIAATLAPPLVRSGQEVVARLAVDRLTLATLPGLIELLAGLGSLPAAVLWTVVAGAGVAVVAARSRLLAAYFLTVAGAQLLAVALAGAVALHVAIVAARYLVVVLPLLLVFVAAALTALATKLLRLRPSPARGSAIGLVAAAVLLWLGPLGWIYAWPNDFTNHISYQADYVPRRYFERFRPERVSSFYADVLARRAPGTLMIVEAPWFFYFHSLAYYQRLHRQHVVVGFVGDEQGGVRGGEIAAADPAIALRRGVALADVAGMRARNVDYLVLHRNVRGETRWPTGVDEQPIDASAWIERGRATFGAPVYEDDLVVVFAVQRAE